MVILHILRVQRRFLTSSPLPSQFQGSSVYKCLTRNFGESRPLTWKERKMVKQEAAGAVSGVKELEPLPSFIDSRQKLWEKFKIEYDEFLSKQVSSSIKIDLQLKDGSRKAVTTDSWKATPYSLAREHVSKAWADSLVIAKVDGKLWDLERPLEKECQLDLITFEEAEGKAVFWHSSAHMLGEALERLFGGHLCYGPPIENGFYYDMFLAKESNEASNQEDGDHPSGVSIHHFKPIESVMKKIADERQPFERLELTKEQLLEMFAYNQFKVRILNEKVTEDRTTVYRCGSLIDLCLGPHVRHTGCVKAFKVTKTSSSYWEGKAEAESLSRVYGISFPEPKQLKEWEKFQEEAAKRDHRRLGKDQDLFFFHELSPGSCFWLPKGAHIYNTLINFIKSEYRKRGFQEVITPNIYNAKLWQKSGHWDHYAENMFSFESEKETFALKPMNCPGHCLMFDNTVRSWRELPLRLADFGVLHRNELSGALSGLTRVRRFQQDDAHIFCAPEQIEQEVVGALDFMEAVYGTLGFTFDLCLATRPEKFLGQISDWDQAEAALAAALNSKGVKWSKNEGDGAFYGPKIDIYIKDALRRTHQCATIQLDFQLPNRFDLKYTADDGSKKKPVIVHRAILGSVERFTAILTENFGGKWPFWLSPRQAIVVTISESNNAYAEKVRKQIHDAGFMVDVELDPGLTIQKKVRNAQVAQYNFILVVGKEEETNGTVNVRTRDNKVHGEISIPNLIAKFKSFAESKILNAEERFDDLSLNNLKIE